MHRELFNRVGTNGVSADHSFFADISPFGGSPFRKNAVLRPFVCLASAARSVSLATVRCPFALYPRRMTRFALVGRRIASQLCSRDASLGLLLIFAS